MENGDMNIRTSRTSGCRTPFGGLILGPVFVLIGVGIFVFLGGTFREAYASRSWPTVQGQVTHSEMTQHRDSDGDMMYGTDITYAYAVNGQQYSGYRVTLMDGSTSARGAVQDALNRYPAGGTVTVYYDPDDPASAILEPGFTSGVLLLGALIVCFPGAGMLAFFGSLWQILRLRFWG
jgi:hypothetical protein